MPGTGARACSSSTKEFHAAMNGRGRAVTMTVSSTSHTTPKCSPSATTNTVASTGSRPSTDIVNVCQPGSSWAWMTVSTTPPRSATTACVRAPMWIWTEAKLTGMLTNARHPRTPAPSAREFFNGGGTISTRPTTRTQPDPAYPGKGTTVAERPRRRARRSRQTWKRCSRRANQWILAAETGDILPSLSRFGARLIRHMTLLAPGDDLLHQQQHEQQRGDDADEHVSGVVHPLRQLLVASRGTGGETHIDRGPQHAGGQCPRHEAAVGVAAHADRQRHQGVQHRQEPGQEDGDSASAQQVPLGARPVLLADAAAQPGRADVRTRPASQPEAQRFAEECADDDGRTQQDALQPRAHTDRRDQNDRVARHHQAD